MSTKRVCIVVVGDVGRSPRMQNHAMSLAKHGFTVDIIGYAESQPRQELLDDNKINFHYMEDVPLFTEYVPRLMAYGLKVMWQACALLFALTVIQKPKLILVQNPPAVPAMAILCLYSAVRSCQIVVDWHNYGHSILSLGLGNDHFVVRIYKWCEMYFGKKGDSHLCVSKALQEDLQINHNIKAIHFPDRAPLHFKPIDLRSKHELLVKLSREYRCFSGETECSSAFTEENTDGNISLKPNRPILLISSTSWTEDEDISLFFSALEMYDNSIKEQREKLPSVICVITGKGPLKEHYAKTVSVMKFQHVKVCLPWLSAEDYPTLLASADLGVSLHTSSSGLDLPMKVVDMFGCGLPVLALNFNCIGELVDHGVNGYVFNNKEELNQQLQGLFKSFPKCPDLDHFRHSLKEFQNDRWESKWDEQVKPVFATDT
uniref:Uncharacterized protein n=1 Tax=Strigamia maritima TaxID=126957 RepID=T1JBS0_STRMM